MSPRYLAIMTACGACGSVASTPMDAARDAPVIVDGPPADQIGTPRMYKAGPTDLQPVRFGGLPYCTYTITLKQFEIHLAILPSGQPTSGSVQDLNVEGVVVSTNPACPADYPVIPANIATYTFQSAKPSSNGTSITFAGSTTNAPSADLTVQLSSVGAAYQATLGFHRNDTVPPLDWSVVTMISLSAQ